MFVPVTAKLVTAWSIHLTPLFNLLQKPSHGGSGFVVSAIVPLAVVTTTSGPANVKLTLNCVALITCLTKYCFGKPLIGSTARIPPKVVPVNVIGNPATRLVDGALNVITFVYVTRSIVTDGVVLIALIVTCVLSKIATYV